MDPPNTKTIEFYNQAQRDFDEKFQSYWNRLKTVVQPMYDASLREESKHFSVEERMEIHIIIHHMSHEGLQLNVRLYDHLEQMITEQLNQLVRALRCKEAAGFLESVPRKEHFFEKLAKRMHRALSSFNRYYVRSVWDRERKLDDVLSLHHKLLQTIFLADIKFQVRLNAIKFILNGGSPNSLVLEPAVIQGLISPRRGVSPTLLRTFSLQKRPVYLLARPLDQLFSMSRATEPNSRVTEELPCPKLSQPQLRESSIFTTYRKTIDHWGILIEPSDQDQLDSSACINDGSYDGTSATGLLCELEVRKEDVGHISPYVGTPVGRFDNRSRRKLWGYTSCSDEEIDYRARVAISSMGREYHPLKNNCQKFCIKLFRCIKIPSTVDELQSDYMKIPPIIEEDVMMQRHINLVPKIFQQISKRQILAHSKVGKDKVLPVEELSMKAKKVLIVITMVFLWRELHLRLYMLIFVWGTLDLLASNGGFIESCRFKKRRQQPYGEYKEDFDKVIEFLVLRFYRELEAETSTSSELDDQEQQLKTGLDGHTRMPGHSSGHRTHTEVELHWSSEAHRSSVAHLLSRQLVKGPDDSAVRSVTAEAEQEVLVNDLG